MFKRKQITDERIIQERRKLSTEAFTILYAGLLIDVFYRSVIARQDIREYWDIALLFFGVCFYLAVRNIATGTLFFEGNRRIVKRVLPSTLLATAVIEITMKWLRPLTPVDEMVIGGAVFFLFFGGVQYLMYYLSNRSANKI